MGVASFVVWNSKKILEQEWIKTHFVYVKIEKTGSTTLRVIFTRFAGKHQLAVIRPRFKQHIDWRDPKCCGNYLISLFCSLYHLSPLTLFYLLPSPSPLLSLSVFPSLFLSLTRTHTNPGKHTLTLTHPLSPSLTIPHPHSPSLSPYPPPHSSLSGASVVMDTRVPLFLLLIILKVCCQHGPPTCKTGMLTTTPRQLKIHCSADGFWSSAVPPMSTRRL